MFLAFELVKKSPPFVPADELCEGIYGRGHAQAVMPAKAGT